MQKFVCILGFGLLVATTALAQPVNVRSGEHDSFTRLVFSMPKEIKFEKTRQQKKISITFEDRNLEFDVTEIFSRISRKRISRIQTTTRKGQIYLHLSCECEVRAFWFEETMLVLDVIDNEVSASQKPSLTHVIEEYEKILRQLQDFHTRKSTKNRQQLTVKSFEFNQTNSGIAHNLAFPEVLKTTRSNETLDEERYAINEQPSLAGENSDRRDTHNGLRRGVITEKSETKSSGDVHDLERKLASFPQVAIRKNGKETSGSESENNKTEQNRNCIHNQFLDVSDWRENQAFGQSLGETRAKIFNERDTLASENIRTLARHYIYYGFGAEANATLQLLESRSTEENLLTALAEIIDTGTTISPDFEHQLNCEGYSAFWAIFYGEELISEKAINEAAIIEAFINLPNHLRRHLGPIASGVLQSKGLVELSSTILELTARTESSQDPDNNIATNELNGTNHPTTRAKELYGNLISSKSSNAHDEFVQKLELLISEGVNFDEIYSQVVKTRSSKAMEDTDSVDLEMIYVVSLGILGQFSEAYEALESSQHLSAEQKVNIENQLSTLLLKNGDQIQILKHYFSGWLHNLTKTDFQLVLKLVELLDSKGFLTEASEILKRDFSSSENATVRLKRAELAISMNRADYSQLQVLGLKGPRVKQIKNAIHLQSTKDERIGNGTDDSGAESSRFDESVAQRKREESRKSLAEINERVGTLEAVGQLLERTVKTRSYVQDSLKESPMPNK